MSFTASARFFSATTLSIRQTLWIRPGRIACLCADTITVWPLGGPIIKDKFFFFGSAERITEDRQWISRSRITGSALVNQLLRDQEEPFDIPRAPPRREPFLSSISSSGGINLSQEVNYTNGRVKNFLPLSAASSLPSARNDSRARGDLLLGVRRYGVARRSGQSVYRNAARRISRRENRYASLTTRTLGRGDDLYPV